MNLDQLKKLAQQRLSPSGEGKEILNEGNVTSITDKLNILKTNVDDLLSMNSEDDLDKVLIKKLQSTKVEVDGKGDSLDQDPDSKDNSTGDNVLKVKYNTEALTAEQIDEKSKQFIKQLIESVRNIDEDTELDVDPLLENSDISEELELVEDNLDSILQECGMDVEDDDLEFTLDDSQF